MSKAPCVAVALLALTLSAGCSQFGSREHARAVRREAKFYQTVSDAYFMLGFEYYLLAKEAEGKGDADRAEEFRNRATLYNAFYRKAQDAADELQAGVLGEGSEARTEVPVPGLAASPSPNEG